MCSHLGAEFSSLLGVHPRVVAYACSAVLIAIGAALRQQRPPTPRPVVIVHALIVSLALCVLVYLPWDARLWVVADRPTVETYPGFKLTRLLLTSVPALFAAAAVAPLVRHRAFVRGLGQGLLTIGAVGAIELLRYRTLLGSGSHADWARFSDTAAFSTIGLSMCFVFALLAAQARVRDDSAKYRGTVAVIVSAAAALAAFALAQRTALAMCIGFTVLGVTAGRHRRIGPALWGALALTGSLAVVMLLFDSAGGSVGRQGYRFQVLAGAADTSAQSRFEMWGFCLEQLIRNPVGHGFGAFPQHHAVQFYPHNVLAEAAFDFGILGVFVVGAGLWFSLLLVARLVRSEHALIGLCLAAGVGWVCKAGDLSAIGNWLGWLYLAAAAVRRTTYR